LWTFIPFTPFIRFTYMYIVRFGFLDGRYGFMIAFFYAFQDYVAKTKYLEMRKKTPKMRWTFQKYVARTCASLKEVRNGGQMLSDENNRNFSLNSNKISI